MRTLQVIVTTLVAAFLGSPALAAPDGSATPIIPLRMTPWSMFLNADWVVKLVMLILLATSVITWAIALAKAVELRKTDRDIRHDLSTLAAAASLERVLDLAAPPSVAIIAIAREEVAGCADLVDPRSADAMTDRLSLRLAVAEADAVQKMRAGFSVLASIGATAPFIGLFGTVWGIMNSFIGISQAQTTNLAVVAPGIAEALLATALGLVAAIPAVLLYNMFSRQMAGFRRHLHNLSARVACLVSIETERAQVGRLKKVG